MDSEGVYRNNFGRQDAVLSNSTSRDCSFNSLQDSNSSSYETKSETLTSVVPSKKYVSGKGGG